VVRPSKHYVNYAFREKSIQYAKSKIMKKLLLTMMLISLFVYSCNTTTREDQVEKWKKEIATRELEFAEMASNQGVSKAFLTFASEDAVLNRNNTVLKGKEAMKNYFNDQTLTQIKLEWTPDFIDVSSSGDLAYTYGQYKLSALDSVGKKIEFKGIFHTVWKRQPDGNWKFVWD